MAFIITLFRWKRQSWSFR